MAFRARGLHGAVAISYFAFTATPKAKTLELLRRFARQRDVGDPGIGQHPPTKQFLESPDLTDAIQAAVADNQGIYSRLAVPLK